MKSLILTFAVSIASMFSSHQAQAQTYTSLVPQKHQSCYRTGGFEGANFCSFFDAVYSKIFNRAPTEAQRLYFVSLYASKQIGAYATIRDLLKYEELLRPRAAASHLDRQANANYITKLYEVTLGRRPIIRANGTGDNPSGILKMRLAGASIEDIEAIFLDHPEFESYAKSFRIRLYSTY